MKSHSKLNLALLAVLLTGCMLFTFCRNPHQESCRTQHPTITLNPGNVFIQADTLGGNAKIDLKVTGNPGNVTLAHDTIQAGEKRVVPVPNSFRRVKINMDYLNPALRVCPFELDSPSIIIMDVLVELKRHEGNEDCGTCATATLTSISNNSAYQIPLTTTIGTVLKTKLDNVWVSINYDPSPGIYYDASGNGKPYLHKLTVNTCGTGLAVEQVPVNVNNNDEGTKIQFKEGVNLKYDIIIVNDGYNMKITYISYSNGTMSTCYILNQ